MSKCIAARTAVVAIRRPGDKEPKNFTLVFPARWEPSDLLKYVRSEHPGETVKIMTWNDSTLTDDKWETAMWMANPRGFKDYPRAIYDTVD